MRLDLWHDANGWERVALQRDVRNAELSDSAQLGECFGRFLLDDLSVRLFAHLSTNEPPVDRKIAGGFVFLASLNYSLIRHADQMMLRSPGRVWESFCRV